MKKITIVCLLLAFAIGFKFLNTASSTIPSHKLFHTQEQITAYMDTMRRAPIAGGEYFLPSSSCRGCHGYDMAANSNINEAGQDVNLVDRWESSMMALSSKDPFWKAKVSHEIAVNPAHAGDLQNKCLDCHAPLGRFTSKYHGNAYYGLSDLATDSLGLDGVSCGACHAIGPNVGSTFSGDIPYDTVSSGGYHVEYGPFYAPSVGPMQLYEGFTPVYSSHMDESRLCSSCHTLITQSVDTFGVYTGGYFAEQATYHEYENSNFPANSIKCQTCHMPQINEPIIIANGFAGLTPRSPFNQHVFAGANSFMLALMKNNKSALGINVPDSHFDSTILATKTLLQTKSLDINLQLISVTADTAYFKVKLDNKAGHKFPSGYPSRRAVLQFVVTDALNDTIFQSGIFDGQRNVIGENPAYEPHHNTINQSNVSQIYEMAMGDVNSNFTTVLERAAILLKDDRIPPAGFTSAAPMYDTVKMSNDAIADPDFNKTGAVEGSGSDYVHYAVPLLGASGNISVKAKVYYQSVPPKWVANMFTFSTPEINAFKPMYLGADQTPILVASDSLNNILLSTNISAAPDHSEVKAWPTLSMDGKVYISAEYGTLIRSIEVFDSQGKLQSSMSNTGYMSLLNLYLPEHSGIYYLKIYTGTKILYKKVVKS